MILVDSRIGSCELLPYIKKRGVECEESLLDFGDVYFEGNGKDGRNSIGIERKTIQDMLNCIQDNRYLDQRRGMLATYNQCYLLLEGRWQPNYRDGTLMEGRPRRGNEPFWQPVKFCSKPVMYSTLRRYLYSISASGVVVMYTSEMQHTAYDITEMYHYWNKPWSSHTSLLGVHSVAIPDMRDKPSLCRRWASSIQDVGVKLSLEAERLFKGSPVKLANSAETDWVRIKGIGVKSAQNIMDEIWDRK